MNISDLEHLKFINDQTSLKDNKNVEGGLTSRIPRMRTVRSLFPDSSATIDGNFPNPGRIEAMVDGIADATATNTFSGISFLTWTFTL